MKPCILGVLLVLIGKNAFSQDDTSFWNSKMAEIAKPGSSPGWVQLKEESHFTPDNFFLQNKVAFRLGQNDSMVLIKTKQDELDFTHYKYQQIYKGVKVEGCEYILHVKESEIVSANGKLACNINMHIIPSVTEENALIIAKAEINTKNENNKQTSGKLVIVCNSPQFDFSPQNLFLAYKFNIGSYWVYVDAHKGTVIKKVSSIKLCSIGTFVPSYAQYGASRTFTTKHRGFPNNDYILKDECRGGGIHTADNGSEVDDGDNQWSLASERPLTTTHWAMQQTFDYYKNIHGRSSFDDNNQEIISNAKTPVNGNDFNASFSNSGTENDASDDNFSFGQANGTDGYNTLDVVGHEFTHGVIEFEANLGNAGEPAALAESFGDIFGELVELYVLGTNDWVHRQEITGASTTPRSLINPKAGNRPSTYLGDFWAGADFHDQGCVQDFWFYLLSVGGNGFVDDDNQNDPYNVSGIGANSAAQIAYRNIRIYLTSASSFADAKNGSIFAAMDLYGNCSNEVLQTVNAWNAVGVTSGGGNWANATLDGNPFSPFFCSGGIGSSACQSLRCQLVNIGFYSARAIDNLTSDCDITAINNLFTQTLNAPVTFMAGEKISLLPGFRSGKNFHAVINPCLTASNKKGNSSNDNEYSPESTTDNNEINNPENSDDNYETQGSKNKEQLNFYAPSFGTSLIITPNPTPGRTVIYFSPEQVNSAPARFEITDVLGKTVFVKEPFAAGVANNIDLSHLQKGIYFLKILTDDEVRVEKVVIE